MAVQPQHRDRSDLCPGLLRTYPAEDGAIVRLRLPGGMASIGLLANLLRITESGSGFVQLTSRGNLQLRGLPDPLPDHLREAVLATELVPTLTHERVRNIISSPLSGIWPVNARGGPRGVVDARPLVAELDQRIRETPALAGLSGRFLFVIDDGRGDVLDEPFDLAFHATSDDRGQIRLGRPGFPGFEVSVAEAVAELIRVATVFQGVRAGTVPQPWHLRELDAALPGVLTTDLGPLPVGPAAAAGAVGPHAVAGLPLGRITAATLEVLRRMTDRVVLTAHRRLVIPGAADRLDELERAGLTVRSESGWAKVSACTGAPGCARATVSTETVARDLVQMIDDAKLTLDKPVHLVACGRHCGAIAGAEIVLVESDQATDLLALVR